MTTTETAFPIAATHAIRTVRPIPFILLALGTVLIAASFFPVGRRASEALWTGEDSAAYDQLASQYKRSTYRSAARSGISEEEWEAQRDKMKQSLDAMHGRLQRALNQPKAWSRCLLWLGALLAGCGGLWLKC